ncbi:MAG: hypothetical protein RR620_08930 [Clostridium sp.]
MKKFLVIILLLIVVGSASSIISNDRIDNKEDIQTQAPIQNEVFTTESKKDYYNLSNPSNTQSRKYIVGKDVDPGLYQLETYGEWGRISYKHDDGTYLSWGILPIEDNPIHEYTWDIKSGGVINVGGGSGGCVGVKLTKISE